MSCASRIAARVYLNRDNILQLVLFRDGDVLTDLSAVTRVTVDLDGGTTVVDSDIAGGSVIWWTDTTQYRGREVDILSLQLGDQGITAGVYEDVAVVIYDAVYTNGLRLETPLKLTVTA